MEAGKLRHRVTIQRDELGEPSDTGYRAKSYVEFQKVWADVRTLAGREIERAHTVAAGVTHTVKIRYLAGIGLTYRVLWGDRTLSINAVVDAENRRRELTLFCTEEPQA